MVMIMAPHVRLWVFRRVLKRAGLVGLFAIGIVAQSFPESSGKKVRAKRASAKGGYPLAITGLRVRL